MHIKKILFALSSISILALTSCGGTGFRHTVNKDLHAYHADLNHDGRIADFEHEGEIVQEDNLTWIEAYDSLIKEANSMAELNEIADALNIAKDELKRTSLARYEILHEAEELLMSTGANLPIYNYGDPYILKPGIKGIYTMNLGYKYLDKLKYDDGRPNNFVISVGTKAETFDPASNSDVSTTIAMNQFLIGAKRYIDGGPDPIEDPEGTKGINIAVLGEGVCDVEKRLVTSDMTGKSEDEYVDIKDCPDIQDGINNGGEKAEDYEGTARYILTMKDGAVWNDGSDITIDDFVYSWARASSGVYNGQPFGVWCTMYDMIRGYNAWNTIGQKASLEEAKASEEWASLTKAEQAQYEYHWNETGCAGGMAGVMKHEGAGGAKDVMIVQLINDCDYFESLLAAPMFMPVAKKNVLIVPEGKSEKTDICEEDTDWWMNKKKGDYLTNGPMQIEGPIDNVDSGGLTLTKAKNITPNIGLDEATAEKIEFKFIDKDSTIYDAYKSNVIQFTNQFPSGVIDDLMKKPDWHSAQQLGLFYNSFNVNDNTFDLKQEGQSLEEKKQGERDRENLRKAVCLLVNRDDISTNVAKKGCYAADGFVSDGIVESCVPVWDPNKPNPNPEITELGAYVAATEFNPETGEDEYVTANWHDRNKDAFSHLKYGDNYEYKDYIMDHRAPGGFFEIMDDVPEEERQQEERRVMEANTKEAIRLAKSAGINYDEASGKFTNFPRLSVLTNNGSGLEDIAERMQAYFDLWGIDLTISTQEWQAFLATRRMGDFAMARQGWVADYNDPRTYLDLCCSDSGNNDTQLGRDSWHSSH